MSNFEQTFLKHRALLKEHFMLNENAEYEGKLDKMIEHLKDKKKVLFLTTSTRWSGDKQKPKSTVLAEHIAEEVGKNVELIDVGALTIYCCEGNVSKNEGNNCGIKDSALKDKEKIQLATIVAGLHTTTKMMNYGKYLSRSSRLTVLCFLLVFVGVKLIAYIKSS
jgi:hypothetical protein